MPNARVALLAAAAVIHIGCSDATNPKSSPPAQITALPRELTEDEVRVSNAANQFSFALFQRLNAAQPDENVFVSPLSISFALGMAMNGASSATLDQMRTTFGFGAAELAEINQGYRGLLELEGTLDPSTTFTIANSVWYQQGFPVHASFIDQVRESFDAAVNASPFDATTVTAVNQWVSDKTNGKIPTILQSIDDDLVMFLINAIYFKGSWRTRFDPAQTIDAPFHAIGGDQPAKLMHREGVMRYLETADFRAVDLPYGSNAYSMTVVLPNEGRSVQTVAASLQSSSWTEWMTRFRDAEVDLHLPRLKLAWERGLIPDLESLGMRAAFVPGGADFTRLSPAGRDLYISVVKQKTYVDVNEEGTEAAAVTNVGISLVSMPVRIPFRVDRPFILVLRERLSGTILFMGKIVRMP